MVRKWLLVLLLFLGCAGCWDMLDIDRRANISAIGIDRVEEEMGPYRMTFEIPIFALLSGDSQGGSGGAEASGKPAWIVSSTGTSLLHIIDHLNTRVWRTPYFGFNRVIVIGEEMAKKDLDKAIDFFNRHQQVRRRMKILLAKGEAKDVIEVVPGIEDFAEIYLDNLIELVATSGRVLNTNLAEVVGALMETGQALIPRVRPEKNEVVAAGAGVIKDWQLVGWLDELETFGANFLENKIRLAIITVESDPEEAGEFAFMIRECQTRIHPFVEDGRLHFVIWVAVEGDILEQFGGKSLAHGEMIPAIDSLVGREIEGMILKTIGKLQGLKADPLGFGQVVSRYLPQVWKEWKGDWEETHFPAASFQVETTVNTRRVGLYW
ncbi:MAG: Ger(x)C family spore germination protein [Limnochordia bacterium]|jgi:Ger(x)C family germination protein